MRIAVAIQALDILGGKERDALAIAAGLAQRGHQVSIVTRSARVSVPAGIVLHRLGERGWTNHGKAAQFARAFEGFDADRPADAVLSFEKIKRADAYYAGDVCFAPKAAGARGWLPRYCTYARLEAECFGPGGPDILFLCRKQADEYQRHYDLAPARAHILPPMIHDGGRRQFYETRAATRTLFGIPETAPLAVSVAIYPQQKGVDRTIATLTKIPGLYLLAIGLANTAPVAAHAARLGVGDRTTLVGYSDKVADILGAGDLMLHPARVENTGLVILESLLAGVPVIASATCGFAEYIARFAAGTVLSEPFDSGAYVNAVRAALKPDVLAEFRRRARESAEPLRAEGGLDRILDEIEDVLSRRNTARR